MDAYVRFSELKMRRRQNRDRILMGILQQHDDPNSPGTQQLHTAKALTDYKTKHVARMLELHRTNRTGAVVHAVMVIQRAWRRYIARSELTGQSHPERRTRSKSLSPLRRAIRYHFEDVVTAVSPKSARRRAQHVKSGGNTLPLLQTRRLRQPQRVRAATIHAPLTPQQRMVYELRAQAASSRIQSSNGWNDDPHVGSLIPDRFAHRFYPAIMSRTQQLPELQLTSTTRPATTMSKKEWVL
jgi:hypothetical protein